MTADTVKQYENGSLEFTDTNFLVGQYEEFNNDGTGDAVGTYAINFTYAINNNIVAINIPKQTVTVPNQGSIVIEASLENGTIKKITSNTLELYFDDKKSGGYEDIEVQYYSK